MKSFVTLLVIKSILIRFDLNVLTDKHAEIPSERLNLRLSALPQSVRSALLPSRSPCGAFVLTMHRRPLLCSLPRGMWSDSAPP